MNLSNNTIVNNYPKVNGLDLSTKVIERSSLIDLSNNDYSYFKYKSTDYVENLHNGMCYKLVDSICETVK